MDMAVCSEESTQMRQNAACVDGIDVMEEAIHQDKIEILVRSHTVISYISNQEAASMPSPSKLDVVLIKIDAEIIRSFERLRVCTWSTTHVKYAAHFAQIIVGKNRSELFLGKRSLPKAIHLSVIHDVVVE